MHFLLHHLLQASTTSTTVAKSKSKGGSSYQLLIVLAVFAVVYFAFLRPRTRKMRQNQTPARQLSVGDSVMTAGGIYGTVVAVDADVVEVEVSPGIVLDVLPKAVSLRPTTALTLPSEAGAAGGATEDDDWFAHGESDDSDEHDHAHDHQDGPVAEQLPEDPEDHPGSGQNPAV